MAGLRPSLPRPLIMFVTDSARPHDGAAAGHRGISSVVAESVRGGVNVVQLREKRLPTPALIEFGLRVRDATSGQALLFVNSDIDAAIALAAEGLHLPEDGAPIQDARKRVGDGMLISRAVHSLEAAERAEREGADLLVLGTIVATASKPDTAPIGLDRLRAICERVRIPVIAIGGITAENAPDVMRAGSAGIAVIGAILDSADPRVAAAVLRSAAVSGMSA